MAFIAALQPNPSDRTLLASAVGTHQVLWCDSWRDLQRHVRQHPVAAAVMDLHAETRKDGPLRVFRFAQRFPLTPLIVWGDIDGRELFRLGKAGAADVIISRYADDPRLVREIVELALSRGVWTDLRSRLEATIDADAFAVVRYATDHIP